MITDGLVLYLPLYSVDLQGSPIISKDSNHFSCTVDGATWTRQGRTFNGDDIILITVNALFAPANFSFGGWYKPSSIATAVGVLCCTDGGNFGISLNVNQNGDGLITGWARSAAAWKTTGDSTTVMEVGTWYHCMMTYDSVRLRLYVNGVEENSSALTTAITYNAAPTLSIGSTWFAGAGGNYLLGTAGEIWLHNRALTVAESLQNYLETLKTYKACWDYFTWG